MPSPFTGPIWPLDPLMMMATGATQDPQLQDQAAHYLAMMYSPPPIPPHRGPAGTTITPPTVPQVTPQMRTPGDAGAGATTTQAGLPTGEVGRPPPSTVGNTSSDGGTNEPGPQAPIPKLRPDTITPSSKDDSVAHIPGEAAGLATAPAGGAWGAGTADPTGTSNTGDTGVAGAGKALSDFGKALAGVAPPARQDERQGLAPLPQHESRFTPVDLMTLIQALSQAGTKTAPQSLGALIGR